MQFAWEEKGIIHLKSEKCAWLATLVFTQSSKCNLWNWKLKTCESDFSNFPFKPDGAASCHANMLPINVQQQKKIKKYFFQIFQIFGFILNALLKTNGVSGWSFNFFASSSFTKNLILDYCVHYHEERQIGITN